MTTITNDWEKRSFPIKLQDGSEYMATCFVYLRLKQVPDPHHWPAHDMQVADWNLEGFDCLPALAKPEHEQEITKQVMIRLEDEYGPI